MDIKNLIQSWGSTINSYYYSNVERLILQSDIDELPVIIETHHDTMSKHSWDNFEKVWSHEQERLANIIFKDGEKSSGCLINSAELLKRMDTVLKGHKDKVDCLGILRFEYTIRSTYWSENDKPISFTFDEPLACLLVNDKYDIPDDILQFFIEKIDRYLGTDREYAMLCLHYSVSSEKHLDGKHVAHYLLEQENLLQNPNKVTLCEKLLSVKSVRNLTFCQFEYREEWIGPNTGYDCSAGFVSYQSMLDSAVYSGNPANVEFAIKNGCSLSTTVPPYGGSTMAKAARFSWKPEYRAICIMLIQQAHQQGVLTEALRGSYRYRREENNVIQYFAQFGHIDLVVICSDNEAGKAIVEVIPHKYTYTENTGFYSTLVQNGVNMGSVWNQGAVFTRSHTWYSPVVTGRETQKFLKQAVVSNLRGNGGCFGAETFDKCLKFIGLNVPDSSEEFIALCFKLRECLLKEIAENDSTFLQKTDAMTDSFKQLAQREFGLLK